MYIFAYIFNGEILDLKLVHSVIQYCINSYNKAKKKKKLRRPTDWKKRYKLPI